jgi:hypothetical protein
MRVAAAGLLAAFATAATGYGAHEAAAERERPLVFDVRHGTFRGIQVGDHPSEMRRRLGRRRCGGTVEPIGEDYFDVGGPYSSDFRDPRIDEQPAHQCVLRYRRLVAVTMPPVGIYILMTADPRAQTDRGVGVGDSADVVKRAYRHARCRPFEERDDADSSPAVCTVVFGTSVAPEGNAPLVLSFGLDRKGDTVRSIWLNPTTSAAIKRLRRRR